MRRVTQGVWAALTVAMALLAVSGAGCATSRPAAAPPPAGDLPLPAAPVVLAANAMEVLWNTQALIAPDSHLTAVWVVGDFLVCHGSDHRIYVIDAKTGVRLWSRDVAAPHEAVWPPTVDAKGNLWLATTTRLMGFAGRDGHNLVAAARRAALQAKVVEMETNIEEFQQRVSRAEAAPVDRNAARLVLEKARIEIEALRDQVRSTTETEGIELEFGPAGRPAFGGAHCYIPDAKGWLQAISLEEGTVSWGRWTNDTVTAGPVVDNSLVYFGGRDGRVYASLQHVRSVVWQYQTEGAIVADLKRTDTGLVLAASLDYALYAFQGSSGRLEWRHDAGEPIRRAPYAFGNQVFLLTRQAGLTALGEAGRPQWRLGEGEGVITADSETVYVLGRGNDLLAVNRTDGKVRFGVPLRRGTLIGVNETKTGILYLASPEGQILAVVRKPEPEEQPAPTEIAPPADEKPAAEEEPGDGDTPAP